MLYKLEDISQEYNNRKILNNINMEIKSGRRIGLVGKNGSGKTTTLKIMANLLLPQTGNVYFNSKPIDLDDVDMLKKIRVFLDPERSLYWWLTGLENLKRILKLRNIKYKSEEEKINNLLKRLDLYKDKDKEIKDYSKGMKAKLLLISCFLGNPEVLLLDEPFEGLDYRSRLEVINILNEYNKKGATIILTGHNLLDLQTFCDKLYWFEAGEIILRGNPKEIIDTIPGEGVIKINSGDIDRLFTSLKNDGYKYINIKVYDSYMLILTNNMLEDFKNIEKKYDDLIDRMELHIKGLEDLYYFSEEVKLNEYN